MKAMAGVSTIATSITSLAGHLLRGASDGRLLVLIYHRVRAQPDPMFPRELHADTFEWQVELIKRFCNPIALSEGVSLLEHGRLPPRSIAVTFDDGYADNATVALPILRRHAVPATFFVATGFLDGGRMWNDTVIEFIRGAPGDSVNLSSVGLGSEKLGPPAVRGQLAEKILRHVKHLHPAQRSARVEALSGGLDRLLPDDLMMTSVQLRWLVDAGMEIGAHTVNHPILVTLSDEEAKMEIADSREVLQRITGKPVTSFAYPNGRPGDDFGSRDRDLVESLGFERAVSTLRGVATCNSDIFQLPRFGPWGHTPEKWLAHLLLAFRSQA